MSTGRQEVKVGCQIGVMTPLVLEQKGEARKTYWGRLAGEWRGRCIKVGKAGSRETARKVGARRGPRGGGWVEEDSRTRHISTEAPTRRRQVDGKR